MKNKKKLISKIQQVVKGDDPDRDGRVWVVMVDHERNTTEAPEGYPEEVKDGDMVVKIIEFEPNN